MTERKNDVHFKVIRLSGNGCGRFCCEGGFCFRGGMEPRELSAESPGSRYLRSSSSSIELYGYDSRRMQRQYRINLHGPSASCNDLLVDGRYGKGAGRITEDHRSGQWRDRQGDHGGDGEKLFPRGPLQRSTGGSSGLSIRRREKVLSVDYEIVRVQ